MVSHDRSELRHPLLTDIKNDITRRDEELVKGNLGGEKVQQPEAGYRSNLAGRARDEVQWPGGRGWVVLPLVDMPGKRHLRPGSFEILRDRLAPAKFEHLKPEQSRPRAPGSR